MPSLDDNIILELLKELGGSIIDLVREGCSQGNFVPQEEEYLKWKLKDFSDPKLFS